jgi:hypothetical protein
MYMHIWVIFHVGATPLPLSSLASSRQGRDAGWHQPLHGCRGQDHLVRWAILGQVLWLYICEMRLKNHWIQTLEIRKNSIWPWFRSSHFSWIFSDTTCPFWILEAFSRSDQHPHGLFQPWRNDVVCHPHRDWSYGRHFMGCSTFSEYTVVADISCAKAGNTHGGGIVAPFCGTCS